MKAKYKDARVEKMVKPLRDADRAAEERYQNAMQSHRAHKAEQRRKAMLLAAIVRRDSLVYDVTVKGTIVLIRLRDYPDIVVSVK